MIVQYQVSGCCYSWRGLKSDRDCWHRLGLEVMKFSANWIEVLLLATQENTPTPGVRHWWVYLLQLDFSPTNSLFSLESFLLPQLENVWTQSHSHLGVYFQTLANGYSINHSVPESLSWRDLGCFMPLFPKLPLLLSSVVGKLGYLWSWLLQLIMSPNYLSYASAYRPTWTEAVFGW